MPTIKIIQMPKAPPIPPGASLTMEHLFAAYPATNPHGPQAGTAERVDDLPCEFLRVAGRERAELDYLAGNKLLALLGHQNTNAQFHIQDGSRLFVGCVVRSDGNQFVIEFERIDQAPIA